MNNKEFYFYDEIAKNFGERVDEAFSNMLDIALEGGFDSHNPKDFNKIDAVLAFLSDLALMWEQGKIIVVHNESETTK